MTDHDSISELEEKLETLKLEHKSLDGRLVEIEKHISMTSEEEVEAHRLKKLKLKKKDDIAKIKRKIEDLKS
ncbi:MAG: DUF465 domain-containing protein [Myxococcota bacterium]|jgi:hypothetical protein|nr:DUF465 domain-containing protein [Deltaproteobacteria bacterium]